MRFNSIQEVIEKTGANAKAAECLGKAGALSNLEEELNEEESAKYAKDLVEYFRAVKKYNEQITKYNERAEIKEQSFREKVEERRAKQEVRDKKYGKRLAEYQARKEKVQEENKKRKEKGTKLLQEPKEPKRPKPLKEISHLKNLKEPEKPLAPIYPKIALSSRERIKLQREILNIYLSGHPLDGIPKEKGIVDIKDLPGITSGSWCTIHGVLQSFKEGQTRNKKLMAKLRIEDKTGSIEVVAFHKLYSSLKGTLEKGELYKITGRVEVTRREKDNGEEFTHTQFKGTKVNRIRVGSDDEWDILYPLLKGNIRILPGVVQKSKGLAIAITKKLTK